MLQTPRVCNKSLVLPPPALIIRGHVGQERFRSMTPMYYRNADAAILVYQITDNDSFEAIQHWVEGALFPFASISL